MLREIQDLRVLGRGVPRLSGAMFWELGAHRSPNSGRMFG